MIKISDTPTMNSKHKKKNSKGKSNEFWVIQTTIMITTTNSNRPYNYITNLFQTIILKRKSKYTANI